MKLIERVYYSLVGKKVKTLLLLLVVTLLGSFFSASFSIYQANNTLEKSIKEALNPIVLIEWGYNPMYHTSDIDISYSDKQDEIKTVIDKLKSDTRLSFIENRYAISTLNPYVDFTFCLLGDNKTPLRLGGGAWFNIYKNGEQISTIEYQNIVNLMAIDNYKVSDIHNGNLNILKGRSFTKDEFVNGENVFFKYAGFDPRMHFIDRIIENKQLYLAIDKIFVDDYSENGNYSRYIYEYGLEIPFKMIGVGTLKEPGFQPKYHTQKFQYDAILPIKTLEKISELIQEEYSKITKEYPYINENSNYDNFGEIIVCDTYIELNSYEELKSFIHEMKSKHGDLIENIYSYTDSYNDVKVVTNNLNTIAIISLVVCSIASIILLSLIIQVFVHERRHEIGIYLSMGESRKKVVTQILLEVLLVGMIGISLSVFTGNIIGKTLSSDLLERQIIQQEEVQGSHYDDSFEINKEEILDTYSVEITAEYVICVYVGGFIVLILSSIYPMNSILKMKPKKMLM